MISSKPSEEQREVAIVVLIMSAKSIITYP